MLEISDLNTDQNVVKKKLLIELVALVLDWLLPKKML